MGAQTGVESAQVYSGDTGPSLTDPAVVEVAIASVLAIAPGREGEARLRALFLAELPNGTWVLNNLVVPGLVGDIDLEPCQVMTCLSGSCCQRAPGA